MRITDNIQYSFFEYRLIMGAAVGSLVGLVAYYALKQLKFKSSHKYFKPLVLVSSVVLVANLLYFGPLSTIASVGLFILLKRTSQKVVNLNEKIKELSAEYNKLMVLFRSLNIESPMIANQLVPFMLEIQSIHLILSYPDFVYSQTQLFLSSRWTSMKSILQNLKGSKITEFVQMAENFITKFQEMESHFLSYTPGSLKLYPVLLNQDKIDKIKQAIQNDGRPMPSEQDVSMKDVPYHRLPFGDKITILLGNSSFREILISMKAESRSCAFIIQEMVRTASLNQQKFELQMIPDLVLTCDRPIAIPQKSIRQLIFPVPEISIELYEKSLLNRELFHYFQILDQALNEDKVILVQCTAGMNRSPSILIWYLMTRTDLPFAEIYAFVYKTRCSLFPLIDDEHETMITAAYDLSKRLDQSYSGTI